MIKIGQKIPAHNPDLVWQEVDDGVVVVAPQQGKVRALNHLGSTVWKMINGSQTINHIYAQLCQDYDTVSAEQIQSDLSEFINDLDKRELIIFVRSQP